MTAKLTITAEEVAAAAAIAQSLATAFDPKDAVLIGGLIAAANKVYAGVQSIAHQTEANSAEVWAAVKADYSDAVTEFAAAQPIKASGK